MAQKVRITSSYTEQQRQQRHLQCMCWWEFSVAEHIFAKSAKRNLQSVAAFFQYYQEHIPSCFSQPLNGGNRAKTIICRNKWKGEQISYYSWVWSTRNKTEVFSKSFQSTMLLPGVFICRPCSLSILAQCLHGLGHFLLQIEENQV